MYRLGVVGAGEIFQIYDKAIDNLPNVSIIAVADPLPERLRKAERSGRHLLLDTHKLLEMNLDGVLILTPNALHTPLTITALDYGHSVLCEKPLSISVEDTQKILALAKLRNRFLSVAMHCRYRPEIKYLYENIRGKIIYFKQIYHENWMSASSWYFNPEISGGGVLLDVGINQIDWILPLTEGLQLHTASFEQADCKVELDCHIEWKYGTGRGVTDLTWRARKEKKITVIETDRGEVFKLDHKQHSIYLNGSLKGEWMSFEYQEVIQDFIRQKDSCNKEGHGQNERSYLLISLIGYIYESCGIKFLGKQFSYL